MRWRIDYTKDADKFITKHNVRDKVRNEIIRLIQKIKGENINIDIKKLEGNWSGYYRLRKGKLRIIFSVNKDEKIIVVEKVDFRGNIYK